MADPTARRLSKLFAGELRHALSAEERRAIKADLEALLVWQTDLAVWRKPKSSVDAQPYVALYGKGKLHGCFGADGGPPNERFARAFLNALEDKRFGLIPREVRPYLTAEVSYVRRVKEVDLRRLEASFELGRHGLGVSRPQGMAVILLPNVARDNGFRARGMLEALVKKARLADPLAERFFSFETERIVARLGKRQPKRETAQDAAARWLARLVESDGSVLFGIEARTGAALRSGEMHHARVAAAIQALDAHGGYASKVGLARRKLARDAEEALAGARVEGWPEQPARVAGTLAHLVRAGVDVKNALLAMAASRELVQVPWHAAQVATALENEAPQALLDACVADLAAHPWAPWTVLALARRPYPGDALSRSVDALVASLRKDAPHRGGVSRSGVPETALTALTVEALRSVRVTGPVRAAIGRGEAFIRSWQVDPEGAPAAFDLEASSGAFLGSPISSGLRADVTGHALLALR
jgi:AMMECR1 domain-containing protein